MLWRNSVTFRKYYMRAYFPVYSQDGTLICTKQYIVTMIRFGTEVCTIMSAF